MEIRTKEYHNCPRCGEPGERSVHYSLETEVIPLTAYPPQYRFEGSWICSTCTGKHGFTNLLNDGTAATLVAEWQSLYHLGEVEYLIRTF